MADLALCEVVSGGAVQRLVKRLLGWLQRLDGMNRDRHARGIPGQDNYALPGFCLGAPRIQKHLPMYV